MVALRLIVVCLAVSCSAAQSLRALDSLAWLPPFCHGHCAYGHGHHGHEPYAIVADELMIWDMLQLDPLTDGQLNGWQQSLVAQNMGEARITATAADDSLGNMIDNFSKPQRWSKWRYGAVQLSITIPSSEQPKAIRFWHNGKAAHPDLIQPQSDWYAIQDGERMVFQRDFIWSNPPLGQSNLQVEIQIGEHWSRLSTPLHLEMVPPPAPVIVAVGSQRLPLMPWSDRIGIVPCEAQVIVQLANIPTDGTVIADIAGYGSLTGVKQNDDAVAFDLSSLLTSGRYRLTLRYAGSTPTSAMSGDRSTSLWVDFYDPQQQIAVDNLYAKMHREVLTKWLAATPGDGLASALGQLAGNVGEQLTTAHTPGEVDATVVHAPDPLALESIANQQVTLLNAIERINSWKAVREQIKDAITTEAYVTDVSFDTAATIPHRTYGPGAQEYAENGLTILEGMNLRVAANGQYCLSFRYVPPQVPCTLNLQLQFRSEVDDPWQAITLAPMTIKSIRELDQPSSEVTHQVSGYSSVLARHAGDVAEIRRRGSATFGFGHKILQMEQRY